MKILYTITTSMSVSLFNRQFAIYIQNRQPCSHMGFIHYMFWYFVRMSVDEVAYMDIFSYACLYARSMYDMNVHACVVWVYEVCLDV